MAPLFLVLFFLIHEGAGALDWNFFTQLPKPTGELALSDIVVTLDSHRRVDIAHPPFWQQRDGATWRPVAPFTPITAQRCWRRMIRSRPS